MPPTLGSNPRPSARLLLSVMRESARYAWWLLIFLFTLLIVGNTALFWSLFQSPTTEGLSSSNQRLGVEFQVRYLLVLERLGLDQAVRKQVIDSTLRSIEDAYAPYEAALYRAILAGALAIEEPSKAIRTLPDLPSEALLPTERRWQAMHWQAVLSRPLSPEQVPELLRSLPEPPSALARQLLEAALYLRAGDVARANALKESLARSATWSVILMGAIFITVALAGVGGLVVLIWYALSKPRLPPRPAPEETPFVYDPLLWALVIFLLVLLNAPTVNHMLREWRVDATNAMYLLAVLLPLLFLAHLRSLPDALGRIQWFQPGFWKQLGVGLMGYAAFVPFLTVLMTLTILVAPALPAEQTNPIGERVSGSKTTLQWLWTFAQVAVLAPIIEEFVFRGVLFKVLWQRTGHVWLSAFVSGYLFAVIHPQFLGGIFPITVLGTVLALVYAHTRSLLPCILIHAVHNGLITLMLWSVVG